MMKFFKIKIKTINKVVGSIASNHMVKGYNFNKPNSVNKLKSRGKLDFEVDFNSIEILNRAKPMDIIYSVPVSGTGIIISNKLLNIIKKFRLPKELQVFDVNAIYKGDNYAYNYFYIYESKEKDIFDFETCEFLTTKFGIPKSEFYNISYKELKRRTLEEYETITPKEIMLNMENINTDIFTLDLTRGGYYVSEELKNAIEEGGCQGIEFVPIEELDYAY